MSPAPVVRDANLEDATSVRRIYAPIVASTHISFELEVPPLEEVERRMVAVARAELPWLVAELDGEVAGYAYATPHGERAAYRWSVDTSVYLADGARGRGLGTTLYSALLDRLRRAGYVSAYAGISVPNDASAALHRRVGFVEVGAYPVAGFKRGRWIDVSLWWCRLTDPPSPPSPPRPA